MKGASVLPVESSALISADHQDDNSSETVRDKKSLETSPGTTGEVITAFIHGQTVPMAEISDFSKPLIEAMLLFFETFLVVSLSTVFRSRLTTW